MNGSISPMAMVRRLEAATNLHDLDALVDCFADDYLNETPAHPARGFRGPDQVRRNWAQLFAGIPDLTVRVVGIAVDDDIAWSEWEMSGTRHDGTSHLMRGVIIFRVVAGRAAAARFYLEPVDDVSGNVDAAIARATATSPPHHDRP
jgi:ketosteroid isomerase-like protein